MVLNNLKFTLKHLKHVSNIRSSSGSILFSLLNLQFKTLSDLLPYINLVLWKQVVCCVCESYGFQLRPAVGVLVVPYSVRLARNEVYSLRIIQ